MLSAIFLNEGMVGKGFQWAGSKIGGLFKRTPTAPTVVDPTKELIDTRISNLRWGVGAPMVIGGGQQAYETYKNYQEIQQKFQNQQDFFKEISSLHQTNPQQHSEYLNLSRIVGLVE